MSIRHPLTSSFLLFLAGILTPVFGAAPLVVSRVSPATASIAEVVQSSQVSIVATLTESGAAYAIGVRDDAIFKAELWDGVTRSFGVSHGLLAFTHGETLFVADLTTR